MPSLIAGGPTKRSDCSTAGDNPMDWKACAQQISGASSGKVARRAAHNAREQPPRHSRRGPPEAKPSPSFLSHETTARAQVEASFMVEGNPATVTEESLADQIALCAVPRYTPRYAPKNALQRASPPHAGHLAVVGRRPDRRVPPAKQPASRGVAAAAGAALTSAAVAARRTVPHDRRVSDARARGRQTCPRIG